MPENEKKENQTPFSLSITKKMIMKDLGASDAEIDLIRSNSEVDEYIVYMQKKNAEPKEKSKEKMITINKQIGHKPADLPEPDNVKGQNIRMNLGDHLDPLSIKKAMAADGARRNNGSRLMVLFDSEHPNGRFF